MKKAAIILMILLMIFSAAACGGDIEENSDIPTYIAVTEATFPPFDTVDEEGNIIGFDMDLITAIGEDQGFKVTFTDMTFDALIPAIQAENADIIAAGMWAEDPERREKVDFSDFYYTDGKVLLIASDNEIINGMDSLTADMKVVSQIGTNYADEITALEQEGKIKEAVILDGFDMGVQQIINGDSDAMLVGYSIAAEYMRQTEGKLKIAGDNIMESESLGFAVKKGNTELLDKINAGLKNLKDNGKYDELCEKWGL